MEAAGLNGGSQHEMGKPSILFINQHYHPDTAATGQILTDLAEYLAEDGFRVGVLCSRGRYVSGDLRAPKREMLNGVDVIRLNATSYGRSSTTGRLLDYATFFIRVLFQLFRERDYDYVVTLTTPPLLCVAAGVAHRIRGQKYGIWSMDLHPDAEIAAGMLEPSSFAARLLFALNDFAFRKAEFVVALGDFMKARLANGSIKEDRIHNIPVWCRHDEVFPLLAPENPIRQKLGLSDRCIVMYSGNAGHVHRFDEVLEAIYQLKDDPEIFFLFAGDGPRRAEIERFVAHNDIKNFKYYDYFPRPIMSASLSLGDIHLLTLKDNMAGIAVPSKLYGCMAAARPVLMVGPERSESGETIMQSGCGLVHDPSKLNGTATTALADSIIRLKDDPALRDQMGWNGREAFLHSYSHIVACRRWANMLLSVAGMPAPPIPGTVDIHDSPERVLSAA